MAAASAQRTRIEHEESNLVEAKTWLSRANNALIPLITRSPGDKIRYWLTWLLLLGGDVAGMSGAAILLGDPVPLAVSLSVAVGVAAVTLGLMAFELRRYREAQGRRKDAQSLSEDERHFESFFNGDEAGFPTAKLAMYGAWSAIFLVGAGILVLRLSVAGTLSGLVYGPLAIAIAAGSWANVYTYSDVAYDLRQNILKSYELALSKHESRAEGGPLSLQTLKESVSRSIKLEFELRGEAAAYRYEAAKHAALAANPTYAGHGRELVIPVTKEGSAQMQKTRQRKRASGAKGRGKKTTTNQQVRRDLGATTEYQPSALAASTNGGSPGGVQGDPE